MVKFVAARGRGGAARGRGGVRSGGVGDARNRIVSKQRAGMVDARDKLVKMAKTGGDARQKLDKIRNLKQGKLEVKKRGAITITKTTKGKLLLTTKKKEMLNNAAAKKKAAAGVKVGQQGNLTRRVGRGGTISISTKKATSALKPGATKRPTASQTKVTTGRKQASGADRRRSAPAASSTARPLTRTIRGELSESARLDQELMNTHVDPLVLQRTVKQNSRRHSSPPGARYVPTRTLSPDNYYDRRRDRSRSPMDYDDDRYRYAAPAARSRPSRGYNDYDDPRRSGEEEAYMRSMVSRSDEGLYDRPRTMADRLDSGAGGSYVSPLQGAKIQVSNLQQSVSQDDITELFGDIGPLKRAKLVDEGVAEVVFVNRQDAQKAVEIYHNRQLDGKAMKCKLVSSGGEVSSTTGNYRMPPTKSHGRAPPPEMGAIHKALFNEKVGGRSSAGNGSSRRRHDDRGGSRGSKPMFTVTMAKKDGSRY